MERERKFVWSWLVGAIAIVLTLPALVVFVERDSLSLSKSTTANSDPVASDVQRIGPDGIAEMGVGTCTVSSDVILIAGSGMTVCRTAEWTTTPYLDQQVSVDAVGIDAGATVVVRFRESQEGRLEVAVGRTAVVIREKVGDSWNLLASVPRQASTGAPISLTTPPTAMVRRLKIVLSGENVSAAIDGSDVVTGRTSIGNSGLFSIGAITSETVAVRLYSISMTDVG